ncbi:unnamed protein product [Sphenostylis stenocarpa]|uniref:Uncharacterized protein n=1 Tax=Sphenostylis stenocarpa TaxID=92480 RepID=A0AA86RPY1_9FABA|nr:unnamed protein product [Sphenostylis stenocarpa]
MVVRWWRLKEEGCIYKETEEVTGIVHRRGKQAWMVGQHQEGTTKESSVVGPA